MFTDVSNISNNEDRSYDQSLSFIIYKLFFCLICPGRSVHACLIWEGISIERINDLFKVFLWMDVVVYTYLSLSDSHVQGLLFYSTQFHYRINTLTFFFFLFEYQIEKEKDYFALASKIKKISTCIISINVSLRLFLSRHLVHVKE
jgi:hypothetical protein